MAKDDVMAAEFKLVGPKAAHVITFIPIWYEEQLMAAESDPTTYLTQYKELTNK